MPVTNPANMEALEAQRRAVIRMMSRAHDVSSRTGEELAAKWTKNICYYLYKRCRDFSPTLEMFGLGSSSIAIAKGYKIAYLKNGVKGYSIFSDKGKKRKDFHRVRDIMRDRGNHRMYIASGWLMVKRIVTKSGEHLQTGGMRNGKIVVDIQKGFFTKISVTITNLSDFARPFHEKHSIVQLALQDERGDLAEYIARKKHEDVAQILKET